MKIEIENLSKCFRSRTKTTQALKQIHLEIESGEILCILGHNGAGKTTLVKSICGLLKPDEGAVRLDGKVVHENLSYAHRQCGAVLEGSRNIYYYLSAYENLRYFGLLNGLSQKEIDEKAAYYLELFDLKEFRDVPANSFSRGMQQKVAVIIALMKEPKVLLLDEPTLGLDIISADSVIHILKQLAEQKKMTIVVTTHDINLIEQLNCRLVFLNAGEVIRDSGLLELKQGEEQARVQITYRQKSGQDELPADAIVAEKQGDIAIFETGDSRWIGERIGSEDLIQIEKCSQSVAEIYKGVMERHE